MIISQLIKQITKAIFNVDEQMNGDNIEER